MIKLNFMQAISTQKFLKMSPRKLRLVAEMIRGMKPQDAVAKMSYTGKRAAEPLAKVIKSAIANARVLGMDETKLIFSEIQIGQGPRLKRWRAGSRGRAKPYTRDLSHIRVVLIEDKKEVKPEVVEEVKEIKEVKKVTKKRKEK